MNSNKRHICQVKNLQLWRDLSTSVNNKLFTLFHKGFISWNFAFAKFRENKTLAKIFVFTVILTLSLSFIPCIWDTAPISAVESPGAVIPLVPNATLGGVMLAQTDIECFHTGLTEFPEVAPWAPEPLSPLWCDLSTPECDEMSCLFPLLSLGLVGLESVELVAFAAPNKGLPCLVPDAVVVGLWRDEEAELRLCCGDVSFALRGTRGGGAFSLSALLALPGEVFGRGGIGRAPDRLGADEAEGIWEWPWPDTVSFTLVPLFFPTALKALLCVLKNTTYT